MVSDEDIAKRLAELLEDADLETATAKAIRTQLEEEFGVDLSHRKSFIREQIDRFLNEKRWHCEDSGCQKEEANEQEETRNGGRKPENSITHKKSIRDPNPNAKRGLPAAETQVDSKRMRAKIERAMKQSVVKEKKKKRASGGGLNRNCNLSPELQAILGKEELPRTQVVKQLWEYIRQNNLQDPENKRKIICDQALRTLFGIDRTDMFKMNKLLSKHVWPIEDTS